MMKCEYMGCGLAKVLNDGNRGRRAILLLLVVLAGFSAAPVTASPPAAASEPATESPIFRAPAAPASHPATPPPASEPTSKPDDPIRVELRVNTYSADSFAKLDAGCTVLVEGTVATVNFADPKLEIALNFCKIIDYYFPGKAPAKPDGVTMTAPSPKDLYGTFKANLEKNKSGKEWDAWVKQQYKNIIGKKVTWRISVAAKVDKTEVLKSLKADLNEMGTCLTEMKKPIMALKHTDAWREGAFVHPASDTLVPADKAAWELDDIKALEDGIRGLGKLIKSKDGYPRILNPIDSYMAAKADEIKSLRAELKDMGNRLRELKKNKIDYRYLPEWRGGNFVRRGRNSRSSLDTTEQAMADIKILEDGIVDLCKVYGKDPG